MHWLEGEPHWSCWLYLDHLICDLLSLSKTKWILCYIDFLPCGLLFTFSLAHCMALGLLGLWNLQLLCVIGEMIKGQWYSQLCQFSLCWLNFYRLSQFPYSLTWWAQTDRMSSCERNLTHRVHWHYPGERVCRRASPPWVRTTHGQSRLVTVWRLPTALFQELKQGYPFNVSQSVSVDRAHWIIWGAYFNGRFPGNGRNQNLWGLWARNPHF